MLSSIGYVVAASPTAVRNIKLSAGGWPALTSRDNVVRLKLGLENFVAGRRQSTARGDASRGDAGGARGDGGQMH